MNKTEELIQECIARAYAHTVNEKKTLDVDLIEAMTEEIMQLLNKELPQTVTLKYDNFQKGHSTISELLDELLK